MIEKVALRKNIRELFVKLSHDELQMKSRALSKQLTIFLTDYLPSVHSLSNDFIFGAYAPMSDEAQWHLEFNLQKSVQDTFSLRTCFPAMAGDEMRFFRCPFERLEWRKDFAFSILCPPRECPQVEPPVLLIPGRAFSFKGDRMGRGKAYYDKYLSNYKGIKIGICLEMQLFDVVPVSESDCPVDYIITESRVIDASKQHK